MKLTTRSFSGIYCGLLALSLQLLPGHAFVSPGLRCRSVSTVPLGLQMSSADANRDSNQKVKVMFVCLGNICRSPAAEAVFAAKIEEKGLDGHFLIESCGTGGGSPDWYRPKGFSYHEGERSDPRMREAAVNRGIAIECRSQPLTPDDVKSFDLLIAMDKSNVKAILEASEFWGVKDVAEPKVKTMMSFSTSPTNNLEYVPDPYYGGADGFENVLDLLDDACGGLVDYCAKQLL